MYLSYFNLKEEPFGVSPDCRFFHETEQHREALATVYYAIQQGRGFALLVGRAGLGKTTILVELLQMLEGKAETAYLPHPFYDRHTVLESILLALGLEPASSLAQNHQLFFEYLTRTRLTGKRCVVIFDEAQDLSFETLEAIRMLSNFETPSEKLVQIVLSGQPRLGERLSQPEYEQLRQRMNVVARLEPLTFDGVHEYVDHRLRKAGSSAALFAPAALDAIAAASGGVPRNINTLCFHSLTLGFAQTHRPVGLDEVEEALRDLDLSADGKPRPFSSASRAATPISAPQWWQQPRSFRRR